jgi:S-adenosylmethionine decarboxylase
VHPEVPLSETPDAVTHTAGARDAGRAEPEIVLDGASMPDLAPGILRQRLVIEGTCREPITDSAIRTYLARLSMVCGMTTLIEPVTHRSDAYGWAGWIHWETSGAHFYAWDEPQLFFSVDIYTCREFDPIAAVRFTQSFFDAPRIVAKSF